MKVPLPANLDLDIHVSAFPPTTIKDFRIDRLAYLLSLLISVPADNERIRKKLKGWVPLYSPFLQKRIHNYRPYLDYALGLTYPNSPAARIIISNDSYLIGKQSKSYRFTEELATSGTKHVEITDKTLLRQFQRELQDKRTEVVKLYPALVKWFNPRHLKIDAENAIKYTAMLRDKVGKENFQSWLNIMNSASQSSTLDYKDWIYSDENLQYQSSLNNIHRIAEGNYFLSVDSNVKRFHSNLTNLKSELRYFLTYQDQHLVSVDLKNSQPFLSLALFNTSFLKDSSEALPDVEIDFDKALLLVKPEAESDQEQIITDSFVSESEAIQALAEPVTIDKKRSTDKFHLGNVAPKIYRQLKETEFKLPLLKPEAEKEKTGISSQLNQLASLVMLVNSWNNTNNPDINQYISSVASGLFYEDFQQKIGTEINIEFADRNKVKEAVFLVLFTANSFLNSEEAAPKRKFKEIFPSVYNLFALFKRVDKTILPRLLQSIESWLVLDIISKRISSENPNLPIFTIHDSIVTTIGNEEYVQKVMEEEIEKYMQYKPKLAVTKYTPDQMINELKGYYEATPNNSPNISDLPT